MTRRSRPNEAESAITARPTQGGKARLRTLADLDRRTKAAQATFELRDSIIADLGGVDCLSAMQREIVDAIAIMGAMAKDIATSYLTGRPIDLAEYTTLVNAQRRLLADIGLERRMKDVTPTIAEYSAQRAAEKAKAA